ncbi:M16 family metallopeptidase [Lactobacillus corticis]|uniref:Peptidase n=1 Tax=Lactobacillus corticis TaxID=2201249 RepID=A0A916QFR9_9LACO|nr:pitrilysin family protein [Lactobacillus corticis]GFZ26199.1 peptidase [Lactobacillus corticis]
MIVPKIHRRTFPSGFSAEIVLRPGFEQQFFGIMVDFGASDPQALAGSAHFLEHKLFAKKTGDISHRFEALGADTNAFTASNETMFYATGIGHAPKIIDLLFELVGEPYFTDSNVAKEAPIIAQELAMYQDDPQWWVGDSLKQQLFGQGLAAMDALGTKRTIMQITPASLKQVYEENYLAGKLHFIAVGDFSANQVKTIFRQVHKLSDQYFAPKPGSYDHTQTTGQLGDERVPYPTRSNCLGLAGILPNFKKVLGSLDLAQILVEIMLESKLSVMSPWFEEVSQAGLLDNDLQISVDYSRQGSYFTILGLSSQPETVIHKIKEVLAEPLMGEFDQQFFALQKKNWLARTARGYNDLSFLAIELAEASLDGENPYDLMEKLSQLSFADYVTFVQDLTHDWQIGSAYLVKSKGVK